MARNLACLLTRAARRLLAVLLLCSLAAATHAEDDFAQSLRAVYGADAAARGHQLGALLNQLRAAPVGEQLRRINLFFNAFSFRTDRQQWNREDYWASPIEFIGRFAGDCEDYAISKYFALRWLGLASESMQLSYVFNSTRRQFHVVLQVSVGEGAEAVILDSLDPRVLLVSQRRDLVKVVGFGEKLITVALPGGGERQFARAGRWSMREWDGVLARTGIEPRPATQSPTLSQWVSRSGLKRENWPLL